VTQFLKLANALQSTFNGPQYLGKTVEEAVKLLELPDNRNLLFFAHERVLSRYCQRKRLSNKGWTGDFHVLTDVFFQKENVIGVKSKFSVLNETSDSITWPSFFLVDDSGKGCLGDIQLTCCLGLQKPNAANLFSVGANVSQGDECWPCMLSDGWEFVTRFTIFDDFSEDLLNDISRFASGSEEWTESEIADVFILRLSLACFGSRFNQLSPRLSKRLRSCICERLAEHAKNKFDWKPNIPLTNLEQITLQNELRVMCEASGMG
jgi:hypothetical protein